MKWLVLIALAGCRGEQVPAAAPATMAAPATKAEEKPVVVAPVSAAPASLDPARLVGRWRPDGAQIAADPDLQALPEAARAEAIQAAARILEGVVFEFGADGAVTLQDGTVTRTGRYVVEPTGVRISLARAEESPREEVLQLRFEGDGLLVTAGEGKSQRFLRM